MNYLFKGKMKAFTFSVSQISVELAKTTASTAETKLSKQFA